MAQTSSEQGVEHSTPQPVVEQSPTQCELMEYARQQATFKTSEMTEMLFGGKEAVALQNKVFARVERALGTDDLSRLPAQYGSQTRESLILHGIQSGQIATNDGIEHKHELFRDTTPNWVMGNSSPFGLTSFLFTPMLKLQGTDEQVAKWLPLAEAGQIMGSYCQTELGHGTFVAGIQTTATFDRETDEFVINTPRLEAIKYWPGGLAFASTHTIVIARLIVDGKDYGVHSFMVQVRSLEDFKVTAGIELGDSGFKMAYNNVDNGWAIFNHVRIPRFNLLSRYTAVSRSGNYTAVPMHEKLLYGGMLKGRSAIARNSAFQLAQALTIATRYSVVRQQGQKSLLASSNSGIEPVIMSYKLQHYRLLMLISRSYAILFASNSALATLEKLQAEQAKGSHVLLPYTHMLMAGLKAWATQTAADGAEEARKMCGGHGYLMMSGLPGIVHAVTAMCTFEGENTVMWKQVSNYLLKGLAAPRLPDDMAYLMDSQTGHGYAAADFARAEVMVGIFEQRAARLVFSTGELVKAAGGGETVKERYAVELQVAARAHIDVLVLRAFSAQIDSNSITTPSPVQVVLSRLFFLLALSTASSPLCLSAGTFTEVLSSSQLQKIREQTDLLLEQLLPDAVALTDAWNFTDASLASALGYRDGDVYRRIMDWTRQLDVNVRKEEVAEKVWEAGVKRFLSDGALRLQARL